MSVDDTGLRDQVRTFVLSLGPVSPEELDDQKSLLDQGAVDSLGLVEIQLYLEGLLGREIEPDELDRDTLISITSITQWLDAALRAAPGGR